MQSHVVLRKGRHIEPISPGVDIAKKLRNVKKARKTHIKTVMGSTDFRKGAGEEILGFRLRGFSASSGCSDCRRRKSDDTLPTWGASTCLATQYVMPSPK
eukprot:12749-Amphidinium_carterae.1